MAWNAYIDTSVLVKLYVKGPETPQAIVLVCSFETPLPLTHLLELEFCNALRLKLGRGELAERAAASAMRDFRADIDAGRYERPIYEIAAVFRRAEMISRACAVSTKCRTLDILHVAAAAEIDCSQFVSFDQRQRAVASAMGLAVSPDAAG